jgi:hypothetical protein
MKNLVCILSLFISIGYLNLSALSGVFNPYLFLNRRVKPSSRIVRIGQIKEILVAPLIDIYKKTGKIKILVDRDGTTDENCIPVMLALKEKGVEFGLARGGNVEDVLRYLGTLKPFIRIYANNAEFWYDVDSSGRYHLVRGDPNAKPEMHPAVEQGVKALQEKFPRSVKEVSLRRGGGATVWYDEGRGDIAMVRKYVTELKKVIEAQSDYKVFSSPTAALISRFSKGDAASDMKPDVAVGDGWQEGWGVDSDMAREGTKRIGLNIGPAEGVASHIYTIEGIKNAAATKLFLEILLGEINKVDRE